ncbi:MAG: hypothetical protein O8C67_05025 [Candidatus Methanoperedens sp.]|nr:hypothetical protein [Candidatus Methanoperedens sp.]
MPSNRIYGSRDVVQQRVSTLELLVQLANAGVDIDPRDRNWSLSSILDSVDVTGSYIISTNAPTNPIIDYDTAVIGTGLSDTHNYVSTGNFRLSSVQVSASGATKIEIKSGSVGFETTKMVAFTTESNLTAQLRFHEELSLTVGQRIQVIVTNREIQNMDVYSTIMGFNT